MKRYSVRLAGIRIENYKNVVNGVLSFENPRKKHGASVLGLYGQNGSGKTVLIDAVELLKFVLTSTPLPKKEADWINIEAEAASFTYDFVLDRENGGYHLSYSFSLTKEEDVREGEYRSVITDEVIRCTSFSTDSSRNVRILDTSDCSVVGPAVKRNLLFARQDETDLIVARKMTRAQSQSFLFSSEVYGLIEKRLSSPDISETDRMEVAYYADLIGSLTDYASSSLFVVNISTAGFLKLPQKNGIMLSLEKSTLIRNKDEKAVESVIESMNTVLTVLIPGLKISLKKLGTEVMASGEEASCYELMRTRNGQTLPLKYESEGIKKIISILQLLIAVYNDDSVTVAVDELDCGIFEYLLGEITRIISEKGRGQLIFTSHNLRPLETLDKGFVAFTTTDEDNRYIRLSNVKATNNLRDFYYRDIMLGGQNEKLYDETSNAEIAFAFREAGGDSET